MVLTDMMYRLSLPQERSDHRIQMLQFGLRDSKTGTGLREGEFIFFLCVHCTVKPFFQSTVLFHFASVADVRRFREFPAGFLFVGDTGRKASAAKLAGTSGTVNAGLAHLKDAAVKAAGTVIKWFAKSAGFFKDEMVTDLLGYGGTIFAEFSGNCLKGQRRIQRMFDNIAAF